MRPPRETCRGSGYSGRRFALPEGTKLSRLRLLSIITHMHPGGAQVAILRLSRGLARRGHAVEVWCLYDETPHRETEDGVQVLLPGGRPRAFGYLQLIIRLVSRLRSARPDGVITFLPLACVTGQMAAWLTGVRCRVASQRNPFWTYGRVMQFCDKLAGSLGIYTCNVANSRSVCASFASYPRAYRRRMTAVYNGINWQPSALTRADARAKFRLPAEAPLVVTVGRLSEQKNQTLLLKTLPKLPQVHLVIAGDGELWWNLQAQASNLGVTDQSHFLGEVSQTDIPDLLRAADIFALPSRFEGQSNALLEAMNAGLPVLVSDIPSQAETLREDGEEAAGWLLPLDDPTSWVQAIEELILNSDLRTRMGALARSRVAVFSLERMIDGFESIIRSWLGLVVR